MNELKVDAVVEHKYKGGKLLVKMYQNDSVVVENESGNLEVFPISELYEVPGDDYTALRGKIRVAAANVASTTGDDIREVKTQLALARQLYQAGVRCSEDIVSQVMNRVQITIADNVAESLDPATIEQMLKHSQPVPAATTTEPTAALCSPQAKWPRSAAVGMVKKADLIARILFSESAKDGCGIKEIPQSNFSADWLSDIENTRVERLRKSWTLAKEVVSRMYSFDLQKFITDEINEEEED